MSERSRDVVLTHPAGLAVAIRAAATLVVLVLLVVVLISRLAVPSALASLEPWAPIATMAGLKRDLAQAPTAWLGRTVRVRGEAVGLASWLYATPARSRGLGAPNCCPAHLVVLAPRLVDPAAPSASGFPLVWGAADPWLTVLRRMPVIGSWAPQPQGPRWGVLTVYRIRLEAVAGPGGDTVEAVLVDTCDKAPLSCVAGR